jgi:hypothetical protein
MIPKFGHRSTGKTLRSQLQGIVHDYMQEHGVDEVDLDEVSVWAVNTGRYKRQPISVIKQCREQLSEACRSEYIKDSQGLEARRMHPVRIREGDRQMVFWLILKLLSPDTCVFPFNSAGKQFYRIAKLTKRMSSSTTTITLST